jgi:hypothetical protein
MKATELRIGNLLMYSNNSEIWTVSGIHEFGIDCFDEIEETYMEYENFEPIPLTEEWLLKLGFVSQPLDDKRFIEFKKGLTSVVYKDDKIILVYVGIQRVNHNNFQFFHQLQNLYFALTGEQLVLSK